MEAQQAVTAQPREHRRVVCSPSELRPWLRVPQLAPVAMTGTAPFLPVSLAACLLRRNRRWCVGCLVSRPPGLRMRRFTKAKTGQFEFTAPRPSLAQPVVQHSREARSFFQQPVPAAARCCCHCRLGPAPGRCRCARCMRGRARRGGSQLSQARWYTQSSQAQRTIVTRRKHGEITRTLGSPQGHQNGC